MIITLINLGNKKNEPHHFLIILLWLKAFEIEKVDNGES